MLEAESYFSKLKQGTARTPNELLYKRISFGTSCMGRVDHIKKTYIQNISTALKYSSNCEFILLNWNSRDGLQEWVEENLRDYIKGGVVKYLHTDTPTVFDISKTKNITLKNSTGEILCSLDADNFISPSFLASVEKVFASEGQPIIQCKGGPMAGRIVLKREHFFNLRGYDEAMVGWGHEDLDLVERFCRSYKAKVHTLGMGCCGRFLGHAKPDFDHRESARRNRRRSTLNLAKNNLAPNPPQWGELP
jgi:hypothetical protein